jgi:oxygen-independent coproporphyrinogen-3 oxidase
MKHLYVHVPFCGRRCSYCDFSIAVRARTPVDDFVTGIQHELSLRFRDANPWTLDTLYFGGGTPSRLGAVGVERLLDIIRVRADLAADAEITLEANPEDVTVEAVRGWRDAGVNRLSIGAQSFDEGVLRWMHRTHDASAIARAVENARAGGIENYSLDLIFALPETLGRDWSRDVERALALEPPHVSLYGLTLEPRTPLGRRQARGEVAEAPDESYEREFLLADEYLSVAHFEHYEVSNFALAGRVSRHNSAYWSKAPYAGIGPSAHEFDGRARRWNVEAYAEWLRVVNDQRDPIGGIEVLTEENRLAEEVYLGLRTRRGLKLSGNERDHVRVWEAAGWANVADDERLVLSPLGWLRLDSLAADLTLLRSRS